MSAVVGAILAAGRGQRLLPLRLPKPLIPIVDTPVIGHQLTIMANAGIEEVFVVVRPDSDEIARVVGDGAEFGLRVHYVEQPAPKGIAHAVGCLEGRVDRPFLLFLGDIFFVPKNLGSMLDMLTEGGAKAVLGVKHESDVAALRSNFLVLLDSAGQVRRVIEKPRHASGTLKGCGIYLFDLPIFDAVRRTPRTTMRDEYEITDAIQILIDDGHPVAASEVVALDMNVTTAADVWRCNLEQLDARGLASWVAPDVHLPDGSTVVRSVIRPGVTFDRACNISNSVVLDGARVQSDLHDVIVSTHGVVDTR